MTPALRRTALAVLVLLGALAVLACALAPTLVENAVRRNLAELPAALAEQGLALEPPEVEEVRFSPLSRELVLRKVRLTGKLVSEDGQASRGSFLSTGEELSLRLTWRGLFLNTPLAPFLLPTGEPGAELVPVAESLRLRETATSVAEQSLVLTFSAADATAENVAMDAALLRAVLADAPAGPRPDALDWAYGFAAGQFALTGLDLGMEAPDTGEAFTATCAEFLTRGLERRHMAEQVARGIRCSLGEGRALTIASLEQEAVALPDKARLQPLLRELTKPQVTQSQLEEAVKTAFSGPEPLLGKGSVTGLVLPLADMEDEALRLERGVLTWHTAQPLDQEIVIEGFSLPMALLEREGGLALPGISTLSLDATVAVRATGGGADAPERHTGNLAARDLCSLDYAFTLDARGYGSELAFLRGTYSGAALNYTDAGLLPRLAASIMPTPEAAMLALKVGVGRVCSATTPENAALRQALETFIERPGSLALTARAPFNLLEALVTVGEGNAGALVSATVTPGPRTLGEAMREVRAQGQGR